MGFGRLSFTEILCCLDVNHSWEQVEIAPRMQGIIKERRMCSRCGKTQIKRDFVGGYSGHWLTTRKHW